jgi:hypothetical protein
METIMRRLLRIINITPARAKLQFNIPDIGSFIDQTCANIMQRILNDPSHPLIDKLVKSTRSNSSLLIKTSKFNRIEYRDSFVQKMIRTLRDGETNLYTLRPSRKINTAKNESTKTAENKNNSLPLPIQSTKPTATCDQCGIVCKSKAGLALHKLAHLRKAKPPKRLKKQKPS